MHNTNAQLEQAAEPEQLTKPGSGFATDVLKLAVGTGSAQALGILATPFLTRLFPPDAFGVAAVFASLTEVFLVIVCLCYELAIMLPADDRDAADVLGVAVVNIVLMTAVTGTAVYLGRDFIFRWLRAPELRSQLWLAPVAVFLGGLFLALRVWNSRKREFAIISVVQVLITAVTVGSQLALGLAGYIHGYALIASTMLSLLVANVVLGVYTWRQSKGVLKSITRHGMRYAVKRYSRFPKFSAAAGVLNNVSGQLPTFLLAGFFSAGVVGEYSLGSRLLRIPMTLIGGNIASVFFQRGSEAKREGKLADSVANAYRYLSNLTIFPCLILTLVGKDIFLVVFGERWAEAGVFTQILSPWVCFWFISQPLNVVFGILEEQALAFRISLLIIGSRFLSLFLGGMLGSPRIALGLFSSTGVLVYGYFCLRILDKSGVPRRTVFRILGKDILVFVPAAAIILALKAVNMGVGVVLAAAVALVLLYFFYIVHTDPTMRGVVTNLIRQFLPSTPASSPSNQET